MHYLAQHDSKYATQDYVSERVYYHDAPIDTVEEDLLSLLEALR